MLKLKNIFTEVEYEAIQYEKYEREQIQKCDKFITEDLNVRLRIVMPKIYVLDLEHYNYETEIKPSDYILRRISDKTVFNVISEDILKSNFEII
jgi:hypothetical protein